MVSRSTIAVSLVVITLLGGCSGLVGDGGTGSADSPDEFDHANGFSANGVTDGDEAVRGHFQELTNRSSYTIEYQQSIEGTQVGVEYRVDIDGEQATHRLEAPSEDYGTEAYYGSDRAFSRYFRPREGNVTVQDRQFSADNLTGIDVIEPLLSNTTAYETSVAERGGSSVVVYELSGAEDAAELFDVEDVTTFEANFSVDADGLVHDGGYDLTFGGGDGGERTYTLSFELTDLDETTVERPDWANDGADS